MTPGLEKVSTVDRIPLLDQERKGSGASGAVAVDGGVADAAVKKGR